MKREGIPSRKLYVLSTSLYGCTPRSANTRHGRVRAWRGEWRERRGGGEVHPYIVNNFYTVFVVSRLASFTSTHTVSNIVTQT